MYRHMLCIVLLHLYAAVCVSVLYGGRNVCTGTCFALCCYICMYVCLCVCMHMSVCLFCMVVGMYVQAHALHCAVTFVCSGPGGTTPLAVRR